MFEKAKPPAIPIADRRSVRRVQAFDPAARGPIADGECTEALPLRAIEWSELTARLSAARDLRQLLRADMGAEIGSQELGFADAASQFFRNGEDDEGGVNHSALERRKASSGTNENTESNRGKTTPSADHDGTDSIASKRELPRDAREEQ